MLESHPLPAPEFSVVDDAASEKADVLIVGVCEETDQSATFRAVDEAGNGWLGRLLEIGDISTKRGDVTKVAAPEKIGASLVLVVGLGHPNELSRDELFRAASTAIRKVVDRQRDRVIVSLGESVDGVMHDVIVSAVLFACEGEAIYRTEPKINPPVTVAFSAIDQSSIDRGTAIGQSINHTRRLVNEPAGIIYPESFADRAVEIGASAGLDVTVWDHKKLESEGCRAMLAVGAASTRPPRLVIIKHSGGGDEAPLAIVGKGVTFDSGGLSLKSSDGMKAMKCDMAGAATVLGVMHAIAKLGVKRNVIGFCGLAENMVSGDSYKLGDVIKTRSGKTIEILNTDAEGRVVLSDTLDVCVEHQPEAIVDLATLTGSCMVALGLEVAGAMTNDQATCDSVIKAVTDEGELVWQLPMFDLYDEKVKSKIADVRNIGEGRWGGAITAAKFLENFVKDVPWVHLDIAGPAFADGPKPYRDAGATGAMVRSLIRWVENASE